MQLIVNGEIRDVPVDYTAEKLIESLGLTDKRLALEVNMEIVPRSTFGHHPFSNGDCVEIVRAIGGG